MLYSVCLLSPGQHTQTHIRTHRHTHSSTHTHLSVADANRLEKLTRGLALSSVSVWTGGRSGGQKDVLHKILVTVDNISHLLCDILVWQRSTFSNRLIISRCSTKPFRNSFPTSRYQMLNEFPDCLETMDSSQLGGCFNIECHYNILDSHYSVAFLRHVSTY